MPVFNYDKTARPLSVGAAFQLVLDGLPIRRGIILLKGPPLMAWLQNISKRRAVGEDPDVKPLDYHLDSLTFFRVVIAPVSEPFEEWLQSVPFSVKAACGETRKRPGPNPKFGKHICMSPIAELVTSDDDHHGEGCEPAKSSSLSPEGKVPLLDQVKANNLLMLQVLAKVEQFEVMMKVMEEKLDRALHLLETQQTGIEQESYSGMEHELYE